MSALPAAFEPMLMVAGRMYHPLIVTLVALAGNLYMDYVNYHVYGAVFRHPRLDRARNSRVARRTLALFQRSPFFAIWLCAWSPIPYWIVSILAPLSRYAMWKYLLATFLGRAPRVWLFVTLGLLVPVSTQVLVICASAALVAGIVIAVYKRPRCVAGAGHDIQEEQPDAVPAALQRPASALQRPWATATAPKPS